MGSLAVNSSINSQNMIHILLNNQCHDSVGGQPTCAHNINFTAIAKACGFTNTFICKDRSDFDDLKDLLALKNVFIEVLVQPGHRENLLRPASTPIENKLQFLESLS